MIESVDGIGELLDDLKKNTFEKYEAFTKKVIEVTAGKVNITKAEDVVFYETKTCIQIVD